MQLKNICLSAFTLSLIFTACKKEKQTETPPPPPPPTTPTVSLADKLKDTTLLYSRDIYLWHNKILLHSMHVLLLIRRLL
jgi:hypothetical protein